ncbi:hypothetical protein TI05_03280 [Achromatium sp. WMS3]|nr:hypothetical protein TI05_03280 [Achromatium sp. WMS3]
MNIQDFIASLTNKDLVDLYRELEKLENKIPTYFFSKITEAQLKQIVNIKRKISNNCFDHWFNNSISLPDTILDFLFYLITENKDFVKDYNEEDLKINFIAPILTKVHYKDLEHEIRAFYDEKLTYTTEEFILTGNCDFYVAKGLFSPEKPYFFIQEFKRELQYSNPQPQLLAELIAAIELNNFVTIKGAYIIGAIWNFVILEKLNTNKYQYFVSENFDSTKIEDLTTIYKNLVFVKNEILNLA